MANPNNNTQYTGGFHDDPLHSGRNNADGYGNGIGGLIDDAFGTILFNDADWSSSIMGELTGYNSQQREFAMQEYMTDKQNRWNSAQEQMKRAKEAGINPLTAAGGIAGNGTSSAASPEPSAAGAAAGGVNAAVDAAGTLGRLGAQNDLDKAIAQDYNAKRDPAIQNIVADTYKKYKEAGYTDLQAQGLAIANAYLPAEKFLGIVAMNANIDVLRGQYDNLQKDLSVKHARIEEINQSIKEMGVHMSLMDKQALTEEARRLQIEAETVETNWFNQKREELGIDPKSPIENQLFMMGVTGNPNYTKGMQIVYDTQYYRTAGALDPQMQFDWDTPPKTMFEFITKGVTQLHDKINGFFKTLGTDSSGKEVAPTKAQLRQSYSDYMQQLNQQYTMLNLMRVDCIDEKTGKVVDFDTYTEIQKRLAELDKMPHSYSDWKKAVYKQ